MRSASYSFGTSFVRRSVQLFLRVVRSPSLAFDFVFIWRAVNSAYFRPFGMSRRRICRKTCVRCLSVSRTIKSGGGCREKPTEVEERESDTQIATAGSQLFLHLATGSTCTCNHFQYQSIYKTRRGFEGIGYVLIVQ